jgi:hypothetical protein
MTRSFSAHSFVNDADRESFGARAALELNDRIVFKSMETVWKKRIQKPIGVYVCAILILIRFGIINTANYFLLFRIADGDVYFPVVVISLAISIFTGGAAIWALTGQNEGRIALLILLPLNVLWVILLAVSNLLNEEPADDKEAVRLIINQTILLLFVIAIEWYFMSKKVVEYYKQDDRK